MKKTLPYLFLILSVIFSTFVWNFISIPYDNSNLIIGEYYQKKINPLNDTLRGIFFIFFSLFVYLISLIRFNSIRISNDILINREIIKNDNINFLSVIFIFFCIFEFLSLNYINLINEIDTHHEGTFLSAQLNFFEKDKLWTGTFFDYGFLGNSIGIFFHYIFDDYSIGIQRFFYKFLILVNKILLILICRKIVNSVNAINYKEALFFLLSLSSLSLSSFYDHVTPFHPRIFLFLIFTLLVFQVIILKKNNIFYSSVVGFFSLLSILFYWDIGTYINALLILFLLGLIFLKRFKVFLNILLAIILSWSLFYIFLPNDEFKELFNQYYIIINISDYLLGMEYPEPFSDKSTRHTKALLFIVVSGVFLINYIFSEKRKENLDSKLLLIFLFISSVIFFKSGLMRSDTPHIKYTSGIYTLLIFFFISYYFVYLIEKIKILKKTEIFFKNKKSLFIFTIAVGYLFFFQNNYLAILNIFDSSKNFQMITKINDDKFLSDDYQKFIKTYKDLVKDENCVQQFTDDNAIPYLVNKPTCTKYYVNAHIIQNWTEENFIEELKYTNPNYIVYSSKINWFKSRNNAPNADKYILDNYYLFKDLSPWLIYKKN
tara:strand:- start:202 stop:2007 length:1806 start_codon:yes stop_codon:yes gene_type:complete